MFKKIAILFFLCANANAGTYTTNLNLYKPAYGDTNYVAPFATGMDTLDAAIPDKRITKTASIAATWNFLEPVGFGAAAAPYGIYLNGANKRMSIGDTTFAGYPFLDFLSTTGRLLIGKDNAIPTLLTGGAANAGVLTTYDENSLCFGTDLTSRICIDKEGNVGFGTNAPAYPSSWHFATNHNLHLYGGVAAGSPGAAILHALNDARTTKIDMFLLGKNVALNGVDINGVTEAGVGLGALVNTDGNMGLKKYWPLMPLDVEGDGGVSDEFSASTSQIIKNATAGSTTTFITASNDTRYCAFPGITILPNGHLIAAYGCGEAENPVPNAQLLYKISSSSGVTWGSEQTLWTSPAPTVYAANGVAIATTGANSIIASFFIQYSTPSYYAAVATGTVSGDTITWGPMILASAGFSGISATQSPVIVLPDTSLMLPTYGKDTGDTTTSARVIFSSDGGLTWGGAVNVAGTGSDLDYNEMGCQMLSSGRILCMVRAQATGYYRTYSDDNGATWSTPALVLAMTNVGLPSILALDDNLIVGVWRWLPVGSSPLVYMTSWDQGLTWSSPGTLTNHADTYSSIVRVSSDTIGVAYGFQEAFYTDRSHIVYKTLAHPIYNNATTISGKDTDGNSLIIKHKLSVEDTVTAPSANFTSTTSTTPFAGWIEIGHQQKTSSCGTATSCSVYCDAGYLLTGGGCEVNGASQYITRSYSDGFTGWVCYANTNSGTIYVEALCWKFK